MRVLVALLMLFYFSAGWAAAPSAVAPMSLRGTVLEVKNVESYTYMLLKTPKGETWAAVARAPVKKGQEVTIRNAMMMTNFKSQALNRTFDRIVLGMLAGANPHAGYAGMAAGHAGVVMPGYTGNVKVEEATGPNAHTIADIVTHRAALQGKTVVVRGTVVRYTPDVLHKNWLHLRDGSGSAADKTNDLAVTTTDEARIGEVVLVKGVVHTDRNLGSGYFYPVLVEDATLEK